MQGVNFDVKTAKGIAVVLWLNADTNRQYDEGAYSDPNLVAAPYPGTCSKKGMHSHRHLSIMFACVCLRPGISTERFWLLTWLCGLKWCADTEEQFQMGAGTQGGTAEMYPSRTPNCASDIKS